jgi:NAD(P)H-hydrate epimerase
VGPGSGVSEALYRFVSLLAWRKGPPLLLDADALGAIAAYADGVDTFFKQAKRPLILTPHPLEFARLVGMTTAQVQVARMRLALTYAKKWGVSLLLKGAGTVITDGDALYINTTGSTALAKGGSGDVLSGAVGALLAQGMAPVHALAAAAYLHGAAGDSLATEFSEYGVLPSDLPLRMAQLIRTL